MQHKMTCDLSAWSVSTEDSQLFLNVSASFLAQGVTQGLDRNGNVQSRIRICFNFNHILAKRLSCLTQRWAYPSVRRNKMWQLKVITYSCQSGDCGCSPQGWRTQKWRRSQPRRSDTWRTSSPTPPDCRVLCRKRTRERPCETFLPQR